MRGTHRSSDSAQPLRGIIPAYAGNTRRAGSWSDCYRDHPRVCGEHTPSSRKKVNFSGIIPAYAGNTLFGLSSARNVRDHPRVCGEHHLSCESIAVYGGSSPRMRGTPIGIVHRKTPTGIIPAYAGNTFAGFLPSYFSWDHPRVCGEHTDDDYNGTYSTGSSPRMRGTRMPFNAIHADGGIIPAYAGNTSPRIRSRTQSWDHPRVCGEHQCIVCYDFLVQGSSPRMRGTPPVHVITQVLLGIIPAYAGNTTAPARRWSPARDHPRVCGEHLPERYPWMLYMGSSPRMRGTLADRVRVCCYLGIIPAYAGNT